MSEEWIRKVEDEMQAFAQRHRTTYAHYSQNAAAMFEIGVLHTLIRYYVTKEGCVLQPMNTFAGEFKYLTTPSGNPANFSYISGHHDGGGCFEIRQQVRVRSSVDRDIAFTPDISVVPLGMLFSREISEDYAAGKRGLFSISSENVIAVHECKSMPAFPELLAGFMGLAMLAHEWLSKPFAESVAGALLHLAPTLFVGGSGSAMTHKMALALARQYPVNIATRIHWSDKSIVGADSTPRQIIAPESLLVREEHKKIPAKKKPGRKKLMRKPFKFVAPIHTAPAAQPDARAVNDDDIPF